MTQIIVTVPGVTFDNMLFGDGWQLAELEGWWDTTKPRVGSDPRPEWHGDFGQDTAYLEPRFITVSGVFQSRENPDLVMSARDVLAALHEAGEFDFTVSDGVVGRVTARLASEVSWDVDYAPGCAWFEFTVKADDPRRYGLGQSFGTGVPTPGVGVDDPVLDPVQEGVAVDVATNYAPSLYGPTVPVEVRRNYCKYANAEGGVTTGWTANNGTVTVSTNTAEFHSGTRSYQVNVAGGTAGSGVVAHTATNSLASGQTTDFHAVWVKAPAGTPMRLFVQERTTADAFVSQGASTDFSATGAWQMVSATITKTVISNVSRVAIIVSSSAAVTFYFDDVMTGPGIDPLSYFDGNSSPDPDMTARWLGAANASESVLEGLHPTGFTDGNCVSIIHEVGDGTRELRQIGKSAGNQTTTFNVPSNARSGGTFVATKRQDAVFATTYNSYNTAILNPQQNTPRTNQIASIENRRTYTALTFPYEAYLHRGTAEIGTGDVYWSKIGLLAGDYTGDWFDGNTQPHDTYIYKWAGVPYESAAIKQQIVHTPGNPGRIELTNTGTAPAEPMVRVTGGLSEGFELLCIETGSVVRVTRPIPDGSVIDIDMGAGQVWIDQQSPLSAMYVPVAEWFSVKPGATCTIQFTPLGVVTGTPMMTVEFAEASW